MVKGVRGLLALSKYMKEKDWDKVIEKRFEIWKLGEAIEIEAKRTKKPISRIAKKYYTFYFKKK